MRNTADVTGGKPIAVLLQSISDVSTINPLVACYDIHGGKREVLFIYFVSDTTRHDTYERLFIVNYLFFLLFLLLFISIVIFLSQVTIPSMILKAKTC
jgi:hypothetical protein